MQAKAIVQRHRIVMIAALSLLLFLTIWIGNTGEVHAATWTTMPSGTGVPTGTKIPLRASDAQVTVRNGGMVQNYTTAAGYTGKVVCVKIPDRTKYTTFSNFATVRYPKAAKIFGRYVDVTVDFPSMTVYPEANPSLQNKDKTMAVARLLYSSMYLSSTDSDGDSGMFYRGRKDIQTKVTITWSQGEPNAGTIVKLPFYAGVSDIDATGSYFQESWIGNVGFDGTIYTWPTNNRIITAASNRMTAPANASTSGNDSWYKAGLIATTSQGSMTMTWVQGNCGAELTLFSQYQDLPAPTKTVDKTSAVKDDLLTWTVNQKVGTFYRDTFTTYGNYSMTDTIPEGVAYQSARVYKGAVDITSWGSLQYNESTRQLTFTMGAGRLPSGSFYNGETISMKITAKALKPDAERNTISNIGTTTISGYAQDTNTVTTVICNPEIAITKKAEQATCQEGETVPFTVTVKQTTTNLTGKNVVITDSLPEGFTLSGEPLLTGVEGRITVSGNTWTATIPELAYNQTATITFPTKAGAVRVEKEVTNTAKAMMEDAKEKKASATVTIRPNPMTLKVEKVWEDQEDFYGLRPEQVTVELLQDGKKMKELSLTAEKDWEGTFADLPEWKTETEKYEYQVKEVQVPEGYQASVSQKDKTYTVTNTLKEYALTIQKEIAKEDYDTPHGDATFLYQITSRENPDWKWYEELSFTAEDAEKGGATLRKAKTVTLPYGTYEIEEQDVLRYQGEITSVSGDAKKLDRLKAEAKLGTDEIPESVTYRNEKVRWDRYSHNDIVINQLQKGGTNE